MTDGAITVRIGPAEGPIDLRQLSGDQRRKLARDLLQEQILDQRRRMHRWRDITGQPAQIDTGYVGQHLVSLVTGIVGGGMRGKGLDLEDGSEVKAANFLDSKDKRGATAPRWNFLSNDLPSMVSLVELPAIYLVSIDAIDDRMRARAWRLVPKDHAPFKERYLDWVEKLGKPKLNDPKRPSANFQLFPPRLGSNDTYARHGKSGANQVFAPLKVELEKGGARKIFHAEEGADQQVSVLLMAA